MGKWSIGAATLVAALLVTHAVSADAGAQVPSHEATPRATKPAKKSATQAAAAAPATPIAPANVLVVGDSLAVGVGDDLQAAMDDYHDGAQVVSAAYPGASLFHSADPDGAASEIGGLLDAHPGTTVLVAEFGGSCWQAIMPFKCGTQTATATWVATQTKVVAEARARGVAILWAVTPSVGPNVPPNGWPEIQRATIDNMASLHVPMIRWDEYVSKRGDGRYTTAMPVSLMNGESGVFDVRKSDGIHLTPLGDQFVAERTTHDWGKWL